MNVRETKEEIKRTMKMYLDKNAEGEYIVPCGNRRPIFMEGAPGIGKKAIIEQIAQEMEKPLVVCSMPHYTRQSALGHTYIAKKEYEGRMGQFSEYAVGEIMGAVYEVMRESGEREGILLLDQINCASEALMPAVLQFLRYRTLGGKRLPEGWVVAASGILPAYDRAAKKFGIAVLDRLNCFKVEGDFRVWKDYAYRQGVHAAVMAFLEMNRDCFYFARSSADGCEYATPRGWEALSSAIWIYEKKGNPVDRGLVLQYITRRDIAEKFVIYYKAFLKYGKSCPAEEISVGNWGQGIAGEMAETAEEERISLLTILLVHLNGIFARAAEQESLLRRMAGILEIAEKQAVEEGISLYIILHAFRVQMKEHRQKRRAANNLGPILSEEYRKTGLLLERYAEIAKREEDGERQRLCVRKEFDKLVERHHKRLEEVRKMRANVIGFVEEAWGKGKERRFFMNELAASEDGWGFGASLSEKSDQWKPALHDDAEKSAEISEE